MIQAVTVAPSLPFRRSAPQDILQDRIAVVWEALLQRTDVCIDDEFEALGGSEELRRQMLAELCSFSGEDVLAGGTIDRLTIRSLSHALVARNPNVPIRAIQAGSAGVAPLVFLHGDLCGGGYYLRELGRYLGAERPIYALRQHGIHGDDVPPSVEAMAADHVEILMEAFPDGGFHLGGHCNGAVVALELARQLVQQRRPPLSLCLVEVPLRGSSFEPRRLRVPDLPPEVRQMPGVRGVWAFIQYLTILPQYRYPERYDGRVAAFWARDGRLGLPEARSVLRRMSPHAEIFTCAGNHITALGRYVHELAAGLKNYLDSNCAGRPSLRGITGVR